MSNLGTALKHVFRRRVYRVRVVLLDAADKPIANRKWKMTPPGSDGTTGSNGLIEVTVTSGCKAASLEVNLRDKAPDPVVVLGPKPKAAYPPTLNGPEFKDKDSSPVRPPPAENDWKWSLTVLDPETAKMDSDDALRGRLHNLGASVDAGGDADKTKAAVKAYQRHYAKTTNPSGVLADIKADLKKRHDTP